ncbi:hypothetical protein CA85_41050 [Allorhodopirellula solitaria]|uniref:DUF2062 domain-containing protein n=2 Tax=Allorhodopirellula solitaria TaxID=2527987 RepID=A0A5C5X317_9BACT|nr:hypothetical protein CA85_41050 [Allorhodopirellula solitaria]
MILWTIKLIRSVRKAIAGRKHPSQLAWGIALGALVGLIPHGNLLAVVLVLLVLMLHVNHAMVALVGVMVTFAAPRLDPTFDAFGRWLFEQPQVAERLSLAWQYPLVPWTDLNNTIVMGSFVIGLISVVPIFLITYPLLRAWAPVDAADDAADADDPDAGTETHAGAEAETNAEAAAHAQTGRAADPHQGTDTPEQDASVQRIDASHADSRNNHIETPLVASPVAASYQASQPVAPEHVPAESPSSPATQQSVALEHQDERDPSTIAGNTDADSRPAGEIVSDQASWRPAGSAPASRPTRVAISPGSSEGFMTTQKLVANRSAQIQTADDSQGSSVDDQHKIDEALSYLLRQLRDSKDKDVA